MSTFEKDLNGNRTDRGLAPIDSDGDGRVETWGGTSEREQDSARADAYLDETHSQTTSSDDNDDNDSMSYEDPRRAAENWDGNSDNTVGDDDLADGSYTDIGSFDDWSGSFGNGHVAGGGTHENYDSENESWNGYDGEAPAANQPLSGDWIREFTEPFENADGEGLATQLGIPEQVTVGGVTFSGDVLVVAALVVAGGGAWWYL